MCRQIQDGLVYFIVAFAAQLTIEESLRRIVAASGFFRSRDCSVILRNNVRYSLFRN